jgi:hypothetical protein
MNKFSGKAPLAAKKEKLWTFLSVEEMLCMVTARLVPSVFTHPSKMETFLT